MSGAMRLMAGKPDGLKRLDLSADGFWGSFAALLVALPPAVLSWIEAEIVERGGARAGDLSVYAAYAGAELAGWLVPLLALMAIAPQIGFSRKIVPLVVALNWGNALLAWALMPLWLFLLMAGGSQGATLVGFLAFLGAIILTVRLVATATGSELPISTAIVLGLIAGSLAAYAAVSDVLGVPLT